MPPLVPPAPDDPPAPASPAEVEREAASLCSALAAAGAADEALRGRLAARLEALRVLWRERPALFAASAIESLRSVSAALRLGSGSHTAARPSPPLQSPLDLLRSVFGHESFRPGQQEIIEAVLAGHDCIGVMPTGAGKSLTYQISARILGGTALVVSPLIALMKDQVDGMAEVGMRATFLNSSLGPDERGERIERLRRGELELLYAAPEGLEASVGGALAGARLSLIAVDEAHCISQWGHDFRPAYRNLSGLKSRFGAIPVLALTATATAEVTRDIARQLGMASPFEVRGSFFRRNLRVHARKKGGDGPSTREAILRLVRARRRESGIVYCLARRSAEQTAEWLAGHGVRAAAYHAGLDAQVRTRVQDAFQDDALDVVVATVAFGMGIDKPDIRYVIHRDMPRSVEAYYQEIGRAGRDGLPSDCVLFYSWADVLSYDRFAGEGGADPEIAAWQRRQVRQLFRLAEERGCRHQALCGHFGEAIEPCRDACDVCTGSDPVEAAPRVGRRGRRRSVPAEPSTADGDAGRLSGGAAPVSAEEDLELFLSLKSLRKRLADARGVPAFYVFSDAVLLRIVQARPLTEDELLEVPGMGPKKVAAYGTPTLELVRARTRR